MFTFDSAHDLAKMINAVPVSFLAIEEYLDQVEVEGRGFCHRYKASFGQVTDPESAYGAMLERQQRRGQASEDEVHDGVVVRSVVLAFQVAAPIKQELLNFSQYKVPKPELVLLAPPVPLKLPIAGDTRNTMEILREDALTEDLSDPEVDRLWELCIASSVWIVNPFMSAKLRQQDRKSLGNKVSGVEQSLQELVATRERCEQAACQANESLGKLELELQGVTQELEQQTRQMLQEQSRLRAEIKRLENEKRRLQGVRFQELKKVSSSTADDLEKLQERVVHIQRQEQEIPQKIEELQERILKLEQSWVPRKAGLEQKVQLAVAALEHFRTGFDVVMENLRKAQIQEDTTSEELRFLKVKLDCY